jgi:hypothetical protein
MTFLFLLILAPYKILNSAGGKMRIIIEIENKTKPFEITPSEFLNWAKMDLNDHSDERRSIGNAVGNIKRCIHCWIDNYFSNLNLSLCGNWPFLMSTSEKIELIKPFGLHHNAIISLLTNIRNEFEHNYQIIEPEQAEAFYETTELWLDNVNKKYKIDRIALIIDAKVIRQNAFIDKFNLEVTKDAHIEYFWFTKKTLFEYKNGKHIEKSYKDIDFKELAKYLENKVKGLYSQDKRIILTQTDATNIYKDLFKFKGHIPYIL